MIHAIGGAVGQQASAAARRKDQVLSGGKAWSASALQGQGSFKYVNSHT